MDAMVKQAAEDFDKIISALEELFDVELTGSPFLASFRNKHRILFHRSSVAKAAFLRNIDPLVHIEYEEDFAKTMLKHVPMVLRYDALLSPGQSAGEWPVSEADGRLYAEIRSLSDILQLDVKKK
eukprot:gene28495-37447_t